MHRRDFAYMGTPLVAGMLAGTCTPTQAAQQPKGFDGFHNVELAIATICVDGFSNGHHAASFREIPGLGFTNVEFNLWYPDTITPQYIESIRTRCKEKGLRPISLQGSGFGGSGRSEIIKDISHKLLFLQYAKALGCHLVKFTGSKRGTNGGLETVVEVCRHLAPAAEELGVLVTLENHAGNVLENPDDYDHIFSKIDSPNIGLCLDTGHFEGAGIGLSSVLEKFAARTLHVDLKDCQAQGQGHHTVAFGQGVTDFDSFLSNLLATGYRGYLVVEQAWQEPRGDWRNDLRNAFLSFKEWQRFG